MNQSCQVFPGTQSQDGTGAVQFTYPAAATQMLNCSAQPHEYEEIYENDRITRVRHWRLMFVGDPHLSTRDKLIWTDSGNVTHTGFVEVSRDEAGRGLAWTVRVTEKR